MNVAVIGHNVSDIDIEVEVRVFNSIKRDVGGPVTRKLVLPAGSTVADIFLRLKIREQDVFLVWCNGRDVTRNMPGEINVDFAPEHGDVIAISGAVPYSWGFGSPIV